MVWASELGSPAPHFTEEKMGALMGTEKDSSQVGPQPPDPQLPSLPSPALFSFLPPCTPDWGGLVPTPGLSTCSWALSQLYSWALELPSRPQRALWFSPKQTGGGGGIPGVPGVLGQTSPSSPSPKGLCPEAGRGVWGERELCAACPHSVPQPHRGQG